jgi:serine/threonine protein kinase
VLPFAGASNSEVLARNTISEIEYPAELWKEVSAEARSLVEKMTERDPYQRFTAQQCLEHPWIAKSHAKKLALKSSFLNIQKHGFEYFLFIHLIGANPRRHLHCFKKRAKKAEQLLRLL